MKTLDRKMDVMLKLRKNTCVYVYMLAPACPGLNINLC